MVKNIQWKLIIIYLLLILFAFQILGVFLTQSIENYYMDDFKQGVRSQAQLLSNFIARHLWEDSELDTIDQLVADFSQSFHMAEVYILDTEGVVISTSSGQERNLGSRVSGHEATRAVLGTPDEVIRANPETGVRNFFYASPVVYNNEQVGVTYVVSSLENTDYTLTTVKNFLLTGTLATVLLTVFLGFLVSKTISKPIEDITSKAEQMAKGNYRVKIDIKSEDEIGQLAKKFNNLASRLRHTIGELSSQKSKMEFILQNLTDGVLAFNKKGELIHKNPLADELLPDHSLSGVFESIGNFGKILNSKEISTQMIKQKDKALLLNFVPFKSEENQEPGIIVVINDITEREKLEDLRREFVANVSHELRTPLTSVKSYVEALQNGGLENKEISESFLQVIEDETERMVRLVKDLLMSSRLDFKKENWQWQSVGINSLMENTLSKVEVQRSSKNQQINYHPDSKLPTITGDWDKLQQVFINIISNSIKYTDPEGNIKINVDTTVNGILITIEDNGIGIPQNDLPRIFERFYRVDKARSRQMGGTGLGLAISKQIVEGHGGNISVQSKEGVGTKFKITLPIESDSKRGNRSE
ncbi:ATP-binding protein [Proteinivorax hydrogeniformans]|uniref:histidine kinase n=2 Tax=Proteinivorax hydrogeniformans TaxID=1826727 RepID=A0AAU8HTU9_9FIRM